MALAVEGVCAFAVSSLGIPTAMQTAPYPEADPEFQIVGQSSCALFRRCGGMLTTRPLAVQTVAAVADMQHCHLNVRAVFSILHTVSEPRHKVGDGEAVTNV